jgi:hypothetical protein
VPSQQGCSPGTYLIDPIVFISFGNAQICAKVTAPILEGSCPVSRQSLKLYIGARLFYTCIGTSLHQQAAHVASRSEELLAQGTTVTPFYGPGLGGCVASAVQIDCKKEGAGHEELQKAIRSPFRHHPPK